jgi:hypothetical protein
VLPAEALMISRPIAVEPVNATADPDHQQALLGGLRASRVHDGNGQGNGNGNGQGNGNGNGPELELWTVSDGNGFQILRFTHNFKAQHKDLFQDAGE